MAKIIHIITRFIDGGADENTLLTCNKFAEKGHRVWLIYGEESSENILSKLDPNVVSVCIPSLCREISLVKDIKSIISMALLLKDISPDVVHTHTSKAGIIGRLACLISRKIKVVHGVHILPFVNVSYVKSKTYLYIERFCALWTDAFISVSVGMKDLCLNNNVGKPVQHYMVESGMDVESFQDSVPAKDVRELSKNKSVAVSYVAALEPRKQHKELLACISRSKVDNKSVKYFFAGKGECLSELKELVKQYKLEDSVFLLGYRDDPNAVISASDICIYASLREGLPRAVVQSAIAKKPLVVTKLPGIESVVQNGGNGIVVEEGNLQELVDQVNYLSTNDAIRASLGKENEHVNFHRWSVEHMVESIEKIYRDIGVEI